MGDPIDSVRKRLKLVIITSSAILSLCAGLLLQTVGVIGLNEAIRLVGANRTPHDGWVWFTSFTVTIFAIGIVLVLLAIYGFIVAKR